MTKRNSTYLDDGEEAVDEDQHGRLIGLGRVVGERAGEHGEGRVGVDADGRDAQQHVAQLLGVLRVEGEFAGAVGAHRHCGQRDDEQAAVSGVRHEEAEAAEFGSRRKDEEKHQTEERHSEEKEAEEEALGRAETVDAQLVARFDGGRRRRSRRRRV